MTEKKIHQQHTDDLLTFADESPEEVGPVLKKNPWKILISDDEKEVHDITKMVLANYEFEDRELEILSAFSGAETIQLVKQYPDVAIILLDVVMETDVAGLEAVRIIREEINNSFIRIILRTGQPGKAPEKQIITRYDINDYKEKTELTAQKLFTAVTSSLRAYRDLNTIEKNRRGLELIINSSGRLYASQQIQSFSESALTQLISILNLDNTNGSTSISGFAVSLENDKFLIIAAAGEYHKYINKYVKDSLPKETLLLLRKALSERTSLFVDDVFVGFFQTETKLVNILYLNGCGDLSGVDRDLIRIFSTNVGVTYDNISLNREIIDTQKEIIETLGGIVETRSKETANHVLRVAEYTYLLAKKYGLPEKESNLLRLSSPMHDVGKIGIPDAILNKPGHLSAQEFELIKSHTNIGYDILNKSKRKILKTAAIVALQHHEHWDGSGYPKGLKGKEIHIYSRITGLLDVYDALSCKRSYKDVWSADKVHEFILSHRGSKFDPNLVDLFIRYIDEFESIRKKYADE